MNKIKMFLLIMMVLVPKDLLAKEKDLSHLTPAKIRALHAQALAEQKSIQILSESLDKQYDRAVLLRDSSKAQLKELKEMDLAKSELEQKNTENAKDEAATAVNSIEERVKAQTNARQGFTEEVEQ